MFSDFVRYGMGLRGNSTGERAFGDGCVFHLSGPLTNVSVRQKRRSFQNPAVFSSSRAPFDARRQFRSSLVILKAPFIIGT